MDKLDTLVTRHLAERLFQSDRLSELLSTLIARRTEKAIAVERRIAALETAQLTPVLIEAFGRTMRENLTTGEIPFRKAYLGSLLERVEVDDREIRILGRKDVLEQCVIANGAIQVQVRRSVPGWLRGQDSNLRPAG